MDLVGAELENHEMVSLEPGEAGVKSGSSLTSPWTAMMMSIWRLAEILYGPCFAPLGGTWTLLDGHGLMMSCPDKPDAEQQASTIQPTN